MQTFFLETLFVSIVSILVRLETSDSQVSRRTFARQPAPQKFISTATINNNMLSVYKTPPRLHASSTVLRSEWPPSTGALWQLTNEDSHRNKNYVLGHCCSNRVYRTNLQTKV